MGDSGCLGWDSGVGSDCFPLDPEQGRIINLARPLILLYYITYLYIIIYHILLCLLCVFEFAILCR